MTRLPLVALLLVAATACGSSSDGKTGTAAPSGSEAASGPTIQIKNFAYNALTVAPGTTITVKNLDDAEHTVTSKEKGLFDADNVSQGSPKTFTAPDKPGTYAFICKYHSSMKGTLTVS